MHMYFVSPLAPRYIEVPLYHIIETPMSLTVKVHYSHSLLQTNVGTPMHTA